MIGLSTKYEEQQRHNISLYCIFYYSDDDDDDDDDDVDVDDAGVIDMLQPPNPIGNENNTAAKISD